MGHRLMQKDIASVFNYNAKTGEIHTARGRRVGFKIKSQGYTAVWYEGRNVLAHRLAWFLTYGEWPNSNIDHINGDPSDNRLANLRLASPSENRANSRANKNNKSGLKGVQFRNGRWRAKITHGGCTRHLGVFDDPAQANAAYLSAAKAIYGEYARAA